AVSNIPRPLPAVVLEDQDGVQFNLGEYRGSVLLVDFIYTRCRSICSVLGDSFQRLAVNIGERGPNGPTLISISFDPDTDTPAALKAYADRYHAGGKIWRFARVTDKAVLRTMLNAFGVVVIPAALGGFQHNAAIHLIDKSGKLAAIFS